MNEYPYDIPRTYFVVYEKSTGLIRRAGYCPADMVPFQSDDEDEIVMDTGDVFYSPSEHSVVDGAVVQVPPPQIGTGWKP